MTDNPYLGLRARALEAKRAELGIEAQLGQPWGVVMETGYPEGSATVVAFGDGNASIYFSGGGGSIGGFRHAPIRDAAKACVALAARFVDHMQATLDFRLPNEGETIFYVLIDGAVLTAQAPEEELGEELHALTPLFFAVQNVIAAYREMEGSEETTTT
jgi:hypothetical protein